MGDPRTWPPPRLGLTALHGEHSTIPLLRNRQVDQSQSPPRAPAMVRWMMSSSAQKVTVSPARCGPSQNCVPRMGMFPLVATTRSNSSGLTRIYEAAMSY
jgi:hypothetical protein